MNESVGIVGQTTVPQVHDRRARTRLRRAVVILIALAAAMIDWLVCVKIIGLDLVVDQGFGPQQVQPVLVAAGPIGSGLTGWFLLAILERFAGQRAGWIWRLIATVVLVGSLWSPITMALSTSTAIALVSMHLVVGAILIIGLPAARSQRPHADPGT